MIDSRDNVTVKLRRQLRVVVQEMRLMGQAWRNTGADALVVMHGEDVLLSFPQGPVIDLDAPMLKAPFRLGDEMVLLCAIGMQEVAFQSRLFADASLLRRIIEREDDIVQLTDEVIDYQDRLLALYDLNHALQYQTKLQHIIHLIAEHIQTVLRVYHAFVVIEPASDKPDMAQVGQGFIPNNVLAQWHNHITIDDRFTLLPSTIPDTSQLLLLPLESQDEMMGLVGLVKAQGTFSMPEIKMASTITEHGAIHIQKSFLIQNRIEQERISVEMSVARDVQMSLLPPVPENIDGLDVWAYCRPALEVGGDFYTFKEHGQSFRFALGDVAGKGISAAILMAMSRTVLHVLQEPSPQRVLEAFNAQLYNDFSQIHSFVTLFTAYYDLAAHQLVYANSGHSPVIYCPAGQDPYMLEADSPPIGVLEDVMASNHTLDFGLDDVLIVSSDGLPEAPQLMGSMLGYQNMLDLIGMYRQQSAGQIGRVLLKAANLHHLPDDDQTIIVIKRVE